MILSFPVIKSFFSHYSCPKFAFELTDEGHAVYARNLPLNATPAQVEEEFKKFGTIKPGGVQVRNHRVRLLPSINSSAAILFCLILCMSFIFSVVCWYPQQYGYCFGFVEFESESSMQAAIEVWPPTLAASSPSPSLSIFLF